MVDSACLGDGERTILRTSNMFRTVKRTIFPRVTIAIVLVCLPLVTFATGRPLLFSSEPKAQQHCPDDTVVWLNLPTAIYHFKGQRWYWRTKSGAYVCRKEADQVGDRPTRNGQ